jgi:hypothetical protein
MVIDIGVLIIPLYRTRMKTSYCMCQMCYRDKSNVILSRKGSSLHKISWSISGMQIVAVVSTERPALSESFRNIAIYGQRVKAQIASTYIDGADQDKSKMVPHRARQRSGLPETTGEPNG